MRADIYLVEKGFFQSRARAQEAIEAGLVLVQGVPISKSSQIIPANADVVASQPHPYVSRGGVKLAAALQHFNFCVKDCVCLDLGASTGGFTQVLLQQGARRIYAVDVGHGQLHPKLSSDPRVVNLEKTDARQLNHHLIPETIDYLVSDVSFISLKLVLPAALAFVAPKAHLAVLVKPQFEAGRALVKRGVVRDSLIHEQVCQDIHGFVTQLGFQVKEIIPSPITGGDGNVEFLLGATRGL